MNKVRIVLLVVGLCLLATVAAWTQEPLSLHIYATDGVRLDTLTLGLDPAATGHIDPALGEREQPPRKPTMDTRFVSKSGYDTIGTGLMNNYHKLVRPTQTDIFRISFQSDEFGHEMQFTWTAGLGASGGAWMITELNGTLLCDMTTHTTYTYHTWDNYPQDILVLRGDSKGYRTAPSESLALAADLKGKIGGIIKKVAVTTEGTFHFLNALSVPATKLYIEFNQSVDLTSTGQFDRDSTLAPGKRTKHWLSFTTVDSIPPGATVTVSGIGIKKDKLAVKGYNWGRYGTYPYPVKAKNIVPVDPDGDNNYSRLPMPNWVTVLSDMYAKLYTGSKTGIVIGTRDTIGYTSKGKGIFKYMKHAKYGDLLKMLYKKGFGTDAPGTAVCLDSYNGKGYMAGVGAIGPDKRVPNRLLAELGALKANLDISDAGFTGTGGMGLRSLLYAQQPGDPGWADAMRIDSIVSIADRYISCDSGNWRHLPMPLLATGQQLLRVVSTINATFAGKMDTSGWWGGLMLKPAKYLYEENTIYRATWAEPAPANFGGYAYEAEPVKYRLDQNYPNPFNPTTIISFELDQDATVLLKIYNMLGQEVGTLVNNEDLNAGTHDVEFDASSLASGVYYYRLIVNDGQFQQVKKMMLLK
jgi:hypothetical protein